MADAAEIDTGVKLQVAAARQDPLSRHELFFRLSSADSFVRNLDLALLTFAVPGDRSGLVQIQAGYGFAGSWKVGGLLSAAWGDRNSIWGSLNPRESGVFLLSRYF